MENEHNEITAASHYPHVLTSGSREQMASMRDDSDRVTLRLSSACPTARDSNEGGPDGMASEIDLNLLSASDQILIETTNSVYNFTVIDPKIPSGRLIGGVLGNRLVDAALIAPCGCSRFARKSLKPGSDFTFIIEWGDDLRRLTTSAVTSLVHRKKIGNAELPACARARVRLEHVSSDRSGG